MCDEVVTGVPKRLELRFHPESRRLSRQGTAFVMRGPKSTLRLEPLLTTPAVSVSAEDLAVEGRETERPRTMLTIRLSNQSSFWRNAVALSWSKPGRSPVKVRATKQGDVWTNGLARLVSVGH